MVKAKVEDLSNRKNQQVLQALQYKGIRKCPKKKTLGKPWFRGTFPIAKRKLTWDQTKHGKSQCSKAKSVAISRAFSEPVASLHLDLEPGLMTEIVRSAKLERGLGDLSTHLSNTAPLLRTIYFILSTLPHAIVASRLKLNCWKPHHWFKAGRWKETDWFEDALRFSIDGDWSDRSCFRHIVHSTCYHEDPWSSSSPFSRWYVKHLATVYPLFTIKSKHVSESQSGSNSEGQL